MEQGKPNYDDERYFLAALETVAVPWLKQPNEQTDAALRSVLERFMDRRVPSWRRWEER